MPCSRELVAAGELVLEQGDVRLADFAPRLSDRQRTLAADLVARLDRRRRGAPDASRSLPLALGGPPAEVASVARLLARQGELVAVES